MKYLPVVWRFFFRNNGGYNITHNTGINAQYIPEVFQTCMPEEWGYIFKPQYRYKCAMHTGGF